MPSTGCPCYYGHPRGLYWGSVLSTAARTIEEEITKKMAGLKTYEIHRTRVSFEAVERSVNRIKWAAPGKDRVILAEHHCANMSLFETLDDVPAYWSQPVMASSPVEGMPF